MAKKGYKVGILDADITGPSIPKMFGAHDQILGDENGLMHPYETKEGIKLISVNLLMDNEEGSGYLERSSHCRSSKTVLEQRQHGAI